MNSQPTRFWINFLLALTALFSAWLLFQVQPMVAKRILPWFGGGTAVWTTSMLFFQTMLFVGYLYAHLTARRWAPRTQALVHAGMLAASVVLLAVVGVLPVDAWKPEGSDYPAWQILAMLAACVGLPYFMLATTAPLVQVWFGRANAGRSPYRLYALSNVGSLAALVSYPLAIEPNIGLARQGVVWSALFAAFAVLCAASGWLSLRSAAASLANESPNPSDPPAPGGPHGPRDSAAAGDARPAPLRRFFWLALPACASVLLLAVTAYLCQDVASMPLLWIAPMVVYLLTFILSFDSDRWYRRWFWLPLAALASLWATSAWHYSEELLVHSQVVGHLVLLLAIGMACHGELARMRPPTHGLTAFYLHLSAGGAIGGLLAGVVAPLLLSDHYELQLSILAAWVLAAVVLATDRKSPLCDGRVFPAWLAIGALFLVLCVSMYNDFYKKRWNSVAIARNFYGALKVKKRDVNLPPFARRVLANGRISHGVQLRDAPRVATQYYRADSGVGRALLYPPQPGPRRIGVVGLGTGTLATYAEQGDLIRFYDINPRVIQFADEHFTFLEDARQRGAEVDVVEGDARLSLERSEPQNFDVLVLDAFCGDAIPTHLLTIEAFETYLRHLSDPNGVLAVHISSQYLDLSGVVQAAAERYGLEGSLIDAPYEGDEVPATSRSIWILLQRPAGHLAPDTLGTPLAAARRGRPTVVWTDDFSNLLTILKGFGE